MNDSHLSRKRIGERVRSMRTALVILLCAILLVLFYLQVWHTHFFFHRSTKNFLRYEAINSLRGVILDCHGKQLATNRPVTSLIWHGSGNKTFSEEQLTMLT